MKEDTAVVCIVVDSIAQNHKIGHHILAAASVVAWADEYVVLVLALAVEYAELVPA